METRSGVCLLHSDRRADGAIGSCSYCASCRQEIAAAVRAVPPGVTPRECFAVALPGAGWRAPPGSGAAHWLAHELSAHPVHPHTRCAAGFAVRRADLLFGRRELIRELPRARDLWVDLDDELCGLVVKSASSESGDVEISIRGLLNVSGGAAVCDFYRDLHARGRFFR